MKMPATATKMGRVRLTYGILIQSSGTVSLVIMSRNMKLTICAARVGEVRNVYETSRKF